MKYTINGYSQSKCVEYGIDYVDTLLLRYLHDFYPKMKKVEKNDKDYVWFHYVTFRKEFPILNFTCNKTIQTRLNKLQEKGILEKELLRNKKGVFSLVRFTDKFFTLVSSNVDKNDEDEIIGEWNQNSIGYTENTEVVESKLQKVVESKLQSNNPSTKDNPSTTYNKDENLEIQEIKIESFVEKFFVDSVLDLKTIIENNSGIKIQSYKPWEVKLINFSRKLIGKTDKRERINKCIEAVKLYSDDKYFPIITNINQFISKFVKIEDYISRHTTKIIGENEERIVKEAFDFYNLAAEKVELTIADKLTDARKEKLIAILEECGGLTDASLDVWKNALRKIQESSFLLGRTKAEFKPGFDFFLSGENFLKLQEGSYNDR